MTKLLDTLEHAPVVGSTVSLIRDGADLVDRDEPSVYPPAIERDWKRIELARVQVRVPRDGKGIKFMSQVLVDGKLLPVMDLALNLREDPGATLTLVIDANSCDFETF